MANSRILDIATSLVEDDVLHKYEYKCHKPEAGSNLNENGEIKIIIETTDTIRHPAASYLLIEGKLSKEDGTAFGEGDKITLSNNGLMYLFSSASLKLNDTVIESVNYPGHATTMLGMLTYPRGFSKAQGLNQCWYKDTDDKLTGENNGYNKRKSYIDKGNGHFSFIVPLKHIFGFCDYYENIIYGVRYELILRRTDNNNAIISEIDTKGDVVLNKLHWYIPEVTLPDDEKLKLFKTIESKIKLPIEFLNRQCEVIAVQESTTFSWKLASKSTPCFPRYIIIGFQISRLNNQKKNAALFDHCNVKSIKAVVNERDYPEVAYDLSFAKNQYARAYRDAALLCTKISGFSELITDPSIATDEYKDLYPLVVINVSHHVELMQLTRIDITIEVTFTENVPKDTHAYALILSDKKYHLPAR